MFLETVNGNGIVFNIWMGLKVCLCRNNRVETQPKLYIIAHLIPMENKLPELNTCPGVIKSFSFYQPLINLQTWMPEMIFGVWISEATQLILPAESSRRLCALVDSIIGWPGLESIQRSQVRWSVTSNWLPCVCHRCLLYFSLRPSDSNQNTQV